MIPTMCKFQQANRGLWPYGFLYNFTISLRFIRWRWGGSLTVENLALENLMKSLCLTANPRVIRCISLYPAHFAADYAPRWSNTSKTGHISGKRTWKTAHMLDGETKDDFDEEMDEDVFSRKQATGALKSDRWILVGPPCHELLACTVCYSDNIAIIYILSGFFFWCCSMLFMPCPDASNNNASNIE